MRDKPDHFNSGALLAIHCAISYADALRSGLGDENLHGDDHGKATESLRKLLPSDLEDSKGLDQLRKLLSRKSRVAYSDQRLSHTESEDLINASVRFETWVNRLGKRLKLEGWNHEDE